MIIPVGLIAEMSLLVQLGVVKMISLPAKCVAAVDAAYKDAQEFVTILILP